MTALLLALVPLLAAPPAPPRQAGLKHFVTRDWRAFCGTPGGSVVADYARFRKKGKDIDVLARAEKKGDPAACGTLPTLPPVMGRLVDHFDKWGVEPRLTPFGPAGKPGYYRVYVGDFDAIASTVDADPREYAPTVSSVSVWADMKEALGPTVSMGLRAYFLAHEMTHVVQRSTRLLLESSPASYADPAQDWIAEGIADAVALDFIQRHYGTLRPPKGDSLDDNPVGIRPYHQPLPITEHRYGTVSKALAAEAHRTGKLYDYRTSSFWRFALERRGGGDHRYFARLMASAPFVWPGTTDAHWVASIDRAMQANGGHTLSQTFGAFLPEFLSWGFTRFANWGYTGAPQKKYGVETWLHRGFGGCIDLTAAGGGAPAVWKPRIKAMAGRCTRVRVIGAANQTHAGLDIVIDGPARLLHGLYLGVGHVVGDRAWSCYTETEARRVRGVDGCLARRTLTTLPDGTARATWTVSPHRLNGQGELAAWLTLASFPAGYEAKWLDRQDTFEVKVGVRSIGLDARTPGPRPELAPDAGPMLSALSGIGARGVRPGLPTAAAPVASNPMAYVARMMFDPESLGTTGLPAEALAEMPAGLQGLALFRYAPDDPAPAEIYTVAFTTPVPLGFRGRVEAAIGGHLDPGSDRVRMAWPAKKQAVPVEVEFTTDVVAMRLDTPLCVADLTALGGRPDPAGLEAALCAERGHITTHVTLPFGAAYEMGQAPAVDPEEVRLGDDADGDDPPGADPGGDPSRGSGSDPAGAAAAGAMTECECTCAAYGARMADFEAVGREVQAIMAALTPEEMIALGEAGQPLIPPALQARVDAMDAFTPCLDRCAEVFATCR